MKRKINLKIVIGFSVLSMIMVFGSPMFLSDGLSAEVIYIERNEDKVDMIDNEKGNEEIDFGVILLGTGGSKVSSIKLNR